MCYSTVLQPPWGFFGTARGDLDCDSSTIRLAPCLCAGRSVTNLDALVTVDARRLTYLQVDLSNQVLYPRASVGL
jgi:hypothetical protein